MTNMPKKIDESSQLETDFSTPLSTIIDDQAAQQAALQVEAARNMTLETIERPTTPRLSDIFRTKLTGVEINKVETPQGLEGKDVFKIEIKDKEKWMSEGNLEALTQYFGPDIFRVFEDRDNPEPFEADNPEFVKEFKQNYLVNGDMGSADNLYVISEGEEIQGFYMLKYITLKDGSRAAYVLLTHIHPSARGTSGLNKKLNEIAFRNTDVRAFIALSHTPPNVKDRLQIGRENGYDGYFAGFPNGNSDLKLSPRKKQLWDY